MKLCFDVIPIIPGISSRRDQLNLRALYSIPELIGIRGNQVEIIGRNSGNYMELIPQCSTLRNRMTAPLQTLPLMQL